MAHRKRPHSEQEVRDTFNILQESKSLNNNKRSLLNESNYVARKKKLNVRTSKTAAASQHTTQQLIPGIPATPLELLNTRPPGMPKAAWNTVDNDEDFMRYPETPPTNSERKRIRSPPTSPFKNPPKNNQGKLHKRRIASPRSLAPISSPRENTTTPEGQKLMLLFKHMMKDDASFATEIDIKKLLLESNKNNTKNNTHTDTVIQEVSHFLPDLEKLRLNHCTDVSDNGICAIAKHCSRIRQLEMTHCSLVTTIGLRQLGNCCPMLESIDFSYCPQINDEALVAVAGVCWNLKKIVVKQCSKITDAGISKLVFCNKGLTHLDISECPRIGEFGDTALEQIGRSCASLRVLDLFGCRYVRDPGLRAVAKGCRGLIYLKLTGCGSITYKSLSALAKNSHNLHTLSLQGCKKARNKDVKDFGTYCHELQWLNVSDNPLIDDTGISHLVMYCKHLSYLDISKCKRVTDKALDGLILYAKALRSLSISQCRNVSQRGVTRLTRGLPRLFTLNLTGCGLGKLFLQELVYGIEFVEWSDDFFGFEPLENAEELFAERQMEGAKNAAAIKIQALFRGMQSRGGFHSVRLQAIERTVLPKIQARVRGHLTRKRIRIERLKKLQLKMCIKIQISYRFYLRMKRARRQVRLRAIQENKEVAAIIFQKIFRGHRDRKLVAKMRMAVWREEQLEYRRNALLELAAIKVQQAYRGHRGRADVSIMRLHRAQKAQKEAARLEAAKTIQRLVRGHLGRRIREAMAQALSEKIRRTDGSIRIQSVVRGHIGRNIYRKALEEQQRRRIQVAATTIQRNWRGIRDRHVGALMISLMRLRIQEFQAAKRIQKLFRGHASRIMVQSLKVASAKRSTEQKAALNIQRIYRGHCGREVRDVRKEMIKLEVLAKPLWDQLHLLEAEVEETLERLAEIKSNYEEQKQEEKDISIELEKVSKIKTKYFDSSRITGSSQRYLTSHLTNELSEQLRDKRIQLANDLNELDLLSDKYQQQEKSVRIIKKKLKPLTEEAAYKAKMDRRTRLQKKVRRERLAATLIQTIFRGYRARVAVSEGGNYWIELRNEDLDCPYYYNTWTHETRWTKPFAMDVFADKVVETNDVEDPNDDDGTNWTECFDNESGLVYYFNNITAECRWEKPDGMDTGDSSDWKLSEQASTSRSEKTRDVGQWEEHLDPESGYLYYLNPLTGETTWSLSPRSAHGTSSTGRRSVRSTDVKRSARWQHEYGYEYNERGVLVKASESRSHWVEKFDETIKKVYYFNELTLETRWEKPQDFEASDIENTSRSWFEGQDSRMLTARSQRILTSREASEDVNDGENTRGGLPLIGEWVQMTDPDSGNVYYYNPSSAETAWSLPPECAFVKGRDHYRDKRDDIPNDLRVKVDKLDDEPVLYPERQNHMEWLQESLLKKDWVKAEAFVEQILDNEAQATVKSEKQVQEAKQEANKEAEESKRVEQAERLEKEQAEERRIVEEDRAQEKEAEKVAEEKAEKDQKEEAAKRIEEEAVRIEAEKDAAEAAIEALSISEEPKSDNNNIEEEDDNNSNIAKSNPEEAWVELDDGSGNTYYYNQVTGESQWEAPDFKENAKTAILERYAGDEWEDAIKKAFADFDTDNTGTIDQKELGNLVNALGYPMTDSQLQKAMASIDNSLDGQISLDEFISWWNNKANDNSSGNNNQEEERENFRTDATEVLQERYGSGDSMEKIVRRAFADFDVDGTGILDLKELGALLTVLGHPVDDTQLRQYMDGFDRNGDGNISIDEFLAWWIPSEAKEVSPEVVDNTEWQTLQDDSGNVYYYNVVTGESQWDPPAFKSQAIDTLAARYGLTLDGSTESMNSLLRCTFEEFDADQTGFIDATELGMLVATLGFPMDENQIETVMLSFDNSGDNQVSVDEFIAWWNSYS